MKRGQQIPEIFTGSRFQKYFSAADSRNSLVQQIPKILKGSRLKKYSRAADSKKKTKQKKTFQKYLRATDSRNTLRQQILKIFKHPHGHHHLKTLGKAWCRIGIVGHNFR